MPTPLDEAAGREVDEWWWRVRGVKNVNGTPDARLVRWLRRAGHPFGRSTTGCAALEFRLWWGYDARVRRHAFRWARDGTVPSDWEDTLPRGNGYPTAFDALRAFWEWFNAHDRAWRRDVLAHSLRRVRGVEGCVL